MSEPIALEADPYHTLPGRDRDHLLAAALYAGKHERIPPASTVNETVGRITGSSPSSSTTDTALAALADADLIERVDGEPNGRSRGVRVTGAGHRTLARGAARLDAAASVNAASALADATGEDRDKFTADDKPVPELDGVEDADP